MGNKAGGMKKTGTSAVRLTDRSEEALAAVREEMRRAAEVLGERMAAHARAAAPVRTGRLRDSIGYAVSEGETFVEAAAGTNVPYAAAQELGTLRTPGKHFLRGAAEEAKSAVEF